MFNAGEAVHDYENMTDKELMESAMDVLRIMYGNGIPYPINYARSNWSTDPNAKLAYAYIAPGCDFQECDAIYLPINQKLWFAGEHTSCKYIGSVHGAYMSGERAALDILSMRN